jgi:AhpD family alkylhydroperoxidase
MDQKELMKIMRETDPFFAEFGDLDNKAFKENAIPKKYKELAMVAISIVEKCVECIELHIDESKKAGATKDEILEAVKMGMMAGGAVTYPFVRHAFKIMAVLGIISV